MQSTTFIIPTAVLQECAVFAAQNGLTEFWTPFYNAAINKVAGVSTTGDGRAPRRNAGAKQTRNRGPSKIVQEILAVLPAEGMPKREILKAATGMTRAKLKTAQPTFEKGVYGYIKAGRWFAGPNPVAAKSAAAAPAGKRPARPGTKEPAELTPGVLTAVRALAPGSTNAQVTTYLANNLGIKARANHVGIALARHQRAGRLEQRNGLWFTPAAEDLRPTG